MPRWARVVVVGLLAVFAVQAAIAARRDSVTIDEFGHLPVGLNAIYTGDFSQDPINPPHTRMFAALPLLLDPPTFSPRPGTSHWGLGYELMQRNVERYQRLFLPARAMIELLALMLGLVVFAWARDLYGWKSGLVAVFLFAFCPELLAHGHLVTLDMSGALGFTATAYATWRMLGRPTMPRAAVAGLALGIASLLKLSGFVLVAVVVLGVAVRAATARGSDDASILDWLRLTAIVLAVALLVINAGYGFAGTLAPLGGATLAPGGALAKLHAAAPWLRLPFPISFVNGIDEVLNVGKESEPSFFLAGQLSSEGWWYYHLAAFALKSPIPILLLGAFACVHWALRPAMGAREYCVFLPILLLFAANSLFNSLQIGVRHVLPVYPLLFVVTAPRVAYALERARERGMAQVGAVVTAALLAWLVAGTVAVAPRYLQYFNEAAGGSYGGHHWLVDSNIDWGQDLIRLREYMDRKGLGSVSLAYFGRVHPAVYGVRFTPLERGASHGIAVVSATFLMGRPYFWYRGGAMRWVHSGTYTWLQQFHPIDRVGALFVYDLP